MKTTVRIALLLSLVIVTACRFAAAKKDDAVRFLAASVVGSLAELQSATPLEQSSFRNAEPVAPRKDISKPAARQVAKKIAAKPASYVAERAIERVRDRARRRVLHFHVAPTTIQEVKISAKTLTEITLCRSMREATSEAGSFPVVVVVPKTDTIGS